MSEAKLPALPKGSLYTHQLLDHEKNANGVHLGVTDRAVCERAYDEGETTQEIWEWLSPAQVLAYGQACRDAALKEAAKACRRMQTKARNQEAWNEACDACACQVEFLKGPQ